MIKNSVQINISFFQNTQMDNREPQYDSSYDPISLTPSPFLPASTSNLAERDIPSRTNGRFPNAQMVVVDLLTPEDARSFAAQMELEASNSS